MRSSGRLQPDEPVLITAADRLHRVGYIVQCPDDGAIVQPTAFDGSPLQSLGEVQHSVLQRDVVRLRDIPSGRDARNVLFQQAGGGAVTAAQLIAPEGDGKWVARWGAYIGDQVAQGVRKSIDPAEWHTAGEIADAIESER